MAKFTYEEMKANQRTLGPTGPDGPIPNNNEPDYNAPAIEPDAVVASASQEKTPTDDKPETEEDYIFKGLREDYPDLAEFDDDVMFEAVRAADFADMDEETYKEALKGAYAPKPSLAGTLKALPGELLKGAKEMVTAGPTAIGKAMGMGVIPGTASLEGPAEELSSIQYQDLINRGYSPEIAQHVMKQRVGTMQEMAAENQQIGEQGQAEATEGAASYISTGLTLGLEGPLAVALAKKGFQTVARRAIEGGVGFSGYEAIKAAGEEKSAGEIFDAGLHGAMMGAGLGAALPPVAKAIFKPFGKMVNAALNIPRYFEEKATTKAAALKQSLSTQADHFAESFSGDWLRTRFSDMPVVQKEVDANIVAASIVQRVLGQDVAENTSASAIARMAEKIEIQRRLSQIDPSISMSVVRPLDPVEALAKDTGMQTLPVVDARQALDAVIQMGKFRQQLGSALPEGGSGGMAPETGVVSQLRDEAGTSMQGVGVEGQQSFAPPGGVDPMQDLQGPAIQAAPEEAIQLELPPNAPDAANPNKPGPLFMFPEAQSMPGVERNPLFRSPAKSNKMEDLVPFSAKGRRNKKGR